MARGIACKNENAAATPRFRASRDISSHFDGKDEFWSLAAPLTPDDNRGAHIDRKRRRQMMSTARETATKAGYITEDVLHHRCLAPRHDAEPIILEGIRFFRMDQCDQLIANGPATGCRLSACKPNRPRRKVIRPRTIDLLRAIFTISQAAKRYRDASQRHYCGGKYGRATGAKGKKEELYTLKEKGIAEAHRQGRLSFSGIHGNLGLYIGEGYRFYSTLIPVSPGTTKDRRESIIVRFASRRAREGRLKDAIHTLEALPEIGDDLRVLLSSARLEGEWSGDFDDDWDEDRCA